MIKKYLVETEKPVAIVEDDRGDLCYWPDVEAKLKEAFEAGVVFGHNHDSYCESVKNMREGFKKFLGVNND